MKLKYFKISILAFLLFSGTNIYANSGAQDGSTTFMLILSILLFLVPTYIFYTVSKGATKTTDKIEGKDAQSWWEKFKSSASQSVELEHEEDVMLDHDYDGIKELGNKLPPWWNWLYVITVVFSLAYIINYHFLGDWSSDKEWEEEMASVQASLKKAHGDTKVIDANSVAVVDDAASLDAGKAIFEKNCIACHGPNGEGNAIGPNMTDEYWIYGPNIKTMFGIITNGTDKGMQAWKGILKPEEMQNVASYILKKLQGTNPANAKAPQGDKYTPDGKKASDVQEAPKEEPAKEEK